jgi:putative membrane protein
MRAEDLFDEQAVDAIEKAVQRAELCTSGEIVPLVTDRSDGYPGVRAAAAAVCAFAAGVVVLGSGIDPWLWLPPAQLAGFAAGYALTGRREVLRRLIPERVKDERVDRAAALAFLEHGLVETRERTGILIYISLLEHRVEVLADRGIHERVEAGTWDGVVRTVLSGIRTGRAEAGLVEAVRMCGDLLAAQFPPRDDDTDELSNELRRD